MQDTSLEIVVEYINEIIHYVNIVDYSELHDTAYRIALATGCRAKDSFFIACTKKTNSIFISNDRLQVENARKARTKTYYLLKEYEELFKEL